MKKERYKKDILIILSILGVFTLIVLMFLLVEPSVWPDEAIYADIAKNFISEGRMGTDLWKGLVPGIENNALWNPPAFFLITAFVCKIFGVTIITLRMVSVFAGAVFLIIFFLFAKKILKTSNVWVYLIPCVLLVLDYAFLKSAKVSRPEVFVLLWGIIAVYLLEDLYKIKKSKCFLISFIIGICLSLSFLSHVYGIIFTVVAVVYTVLGEHIKKRNLNLLLIISTSFLLPIAAWLISISSNYNIFIQQLKLAVERKNLEVSWLSEVFSRQPIPLPVLFLCFFAISLSFLFLIIYKKIWKRYLLLVILLVVSWISAIYGKQFWYYVIPIPFTYLAAGVLLKEVQAQSYRYVLFGIVILAALMNIWTCCVIASYVENKSYYEFTQEVNSIIPEGNTVFLSVIPDPYFGFHERKEIKLYEFPVLSTSLEAYEDILNECDFIVYSGSYEQVLFGDFLVKYILENKEEITQVGSTGEYQASIIKLKDKLERKSVIISE